MNHLIRSVRPKMLNRRQSRFRHEHETCALCGTSLVLKFERIQEKAQETSQGEATAKNLVREIAECPACSIRARSTDHSLQ